jgi:glyoxylase-like metal-dependent hydrolase (beta-lactamase superfamily II)
MPEDDRLPDGVVRVRADNPSALTLDGTNTYLVDGWVVDPGPDDAPHLDAVEHAAAGRIDGIVITHDHPDHSAGAEELGRRAGVEVSRPAAGRIGPFEAIATPGHTADHVTLIRARVAFTGDTVLGAGSVFVSPGEGSMGDYLDSLERLRTLELDAICPGHGPVIWDPAAVLDAYVRHRLERERRILDALERGARDVDALLAQAWSDVDLDSAPFIRLAAGLTLKAHLQKLAAEGRLPPGFPRAVVDG